ncbi:hypothetical protein J3458_014456 [Metarhizium acridum]|uniref:uncharacterized protein n=1 Tax=Metarhizium acridum TaxID=92637 RepID=UPI001C6BB1EF|nr:hypothetical protein J3458_014456 [Metarhizium acridum]
MHSRTVLQAACVVGSSYVYLVRAQTLAINNVGVIDMVTGQVQESQNILINGNRIVSMQSEEISPGAEHNFDATGRFVMPGLADMHVHLYFTNDPANFATTDNSVLPALLANGVTTVQDLGSNCDAVKDTVQRIGHNELLGPRIFTTCEMLDGEESQFETVKRLRDPEAVENEVQKLMAQGVNRIKVHLRPSRPVFQAIAAACQKNKHHVWGTRP